MFDHVVVAHAGMHAFSKTNQGVVRVVAQWAFVIEEKLRLGIAPGTVAAATAIVAIGYAVPVALAMRSLVRRGRLLDHVVVCGLAAAAALFYSPVTWHHDYLMFMPFAASSPAWLIDRHRETAARWLTGGAVGAFLLQGVPAFGRAAAPALAPLAAVCVVAFALMVIESTRFPPGIAQS